MFAESRSRVLYSFPPTFLSTVSAARTSQSGAAVSFLGGGAPALCSVERVRTRLDRVVKASKLSNSPLHLVRHFKLLAGPDFRRPARPTT